MKILKAPQSGSIAGTTAGRNRFGQYERSRAIPVNPNSSAQGLVRARMSANSAAYRALTSAQRAGWAGLGNSMVRTDSLGQTYTLQGNQAYASVNNNRLMSTLAVVTDAPALVTPLGPGRFSARFSGGPDRSPGPISPGQPAVCYADGRVLGGGWIES